MDEVERWWIGGDFGADREACLCKLRRVVAAGPRERPGRDARGRYGFPLSRE